MPLPDLLRRASSYFLGLEFDENDPIDYVDNEILFCKNNVCVHPPTIARHELDVIHHPGYLTVTTKVFTDQHNNAKRPTLFLNWIPNSTLKKCPMTTETSSPYEELSPKSPKPLTKGENRRIVDPINEVAFSDSETNSLNSNSDKQSVKSNGDGVEIDCAAKDNVFVNSSDYGEIFEYEKQHTRSQSMTSVNITIANPNIENVDLTPDSMCGDRYIRSVSLSSCDEGNPNWMSTPEFLALKHNLAFPDSVHSSPVVHKRVPVKCRR